MAMTLRTGKTTTISEINVTPMADVMIVLLIIFMVTVPIISRPVELPDAARAKETKGERIEAVLGPGGVITVGQESFGSAAAFGDYLSLRYSGGAGPTILIQADRSAPYSEVAGLLDACRRAGAAQIALGARLPVGGL